MGGSGELFHKVLPDGTVVYAFKATITKGDPYNQHTFRGHIMVIKRTESEDPTKLEVSDMDSMLTQALDQFGVVSAPADLEQLQRTGLRQVGVQIFGKASRSWPYEKLVEKLAEKGITSTDIEMALDGNHQPYLRLRPEVRDEIAKTVPRAALRHGWQQGGDLAAFKKAIENGGLQSAARRIAGGYPKSGASTRADIEREGSDWSFHYWALESKNFDPSFSMLTSEDYTLLKQLLQATQDTGIGGGQIQSITPLEFAIERTDTAWTNSDAYGMPDKHVPITETTYSAAQPLIRGQIPMSRQVHVFSTEDARDAAIAHAQSVGVTAIDGIPIEALFLWREDPALVDRFKQLRALWLAAGWIKPL